MKNEEKKKQRFVEVLHYGEESFPTQNGKDLSARIVLHFGGRKLDSSPCGEEFAGKDSFALQGEESLTPSPCGEGFVGRDSCAFRGEEKV